MRFCVLRTPSELVNALLQELQIELPRPVRQDHDFCFDDSSVLFN